MFCCIVADCGSLSNPINGSVVQSSVVSVLGDVHQPTITSFSCNVGYELSGSSETVCLANGSWSSSQPTCKCEWLVVFIIMVTGAIVIIYTVVTECDELPNPSNGKMDGEYRIYQSTVFFSCDVGYFLNGSSNRTCQADGTWSGHETICQRTLFIILL